MSGIKTLISGPPKIKKDKKQEQMLADQLKNEKLRGEQADRALLSSRRARQAGGGFGRSGLAYVAPTSGPAATLG